MKGRIYASGDFRRLEAAAAEELADLRSDDPAAEAIVLAGSNLLCAHLRRTLGERLGGLFNARFVTFPDLITLIEDRSGGSRPGEVSRISSMVLLEEILAEDTPACFTGAAAADGFAALLHSTFTDLAEGGCGAGEASLILESGDRRLRSDRLKGVLDLYSRFRKRVEELGGDVNSRFAAARSAAGALSGSAVFAYGFYDLNELQYRVLASASLRCDIAVFIPYEEDPAFRFARPLVARLERDGLRHIHLDSASAAGPEVDMFSAPDAVEEAREVVRRIIEMSGPSGSVPGEIAVMPWSRGDWPPLREALEEAGIEWYSRIDSYQAASCERLWALRLLDYLCGDGRRSELVDLLVSSPMQPEASTAAGADPFSSWVRASAAEGMMGESGWDAENERLLEKARRRESDAGAAATASAALDEAAGIISSLERARAAFVVCRDWTSFSSVFAGAVASLLGDVVEAAVVARAVEEMAVLDRISGSCDAARFRRIARTVIGPASEKRGDAGGSCVKVVTPGGARGLGFGATFITGLKEGSAPARIRQDPFIKDSEREAISGATGGRVRLAPRTGRLEESALIFRLACSSAAGTLTCSWPRLETGGGGEYLPSIYLRRLEGAQSRVPLRGRPIGTEMPLSEDDYDYLMTGRRTGKSVHYPDSPFFARGAQMIESRWGKWRFTPYDGVFESGRALDAVGSVMARTGWDLSATSLQSYANCPFAFLVEKLIGVETVEEPEKKITIDPLQRGTLIHLVLENLYKAMAAEGILPLAADTLSAALGVAGRIVPETLDRYADTEPVGHPLFWEFERRTIGGEVKELLAEEAREGGRFIPEMFEQWFGGGGTRVTFEAAGRTLSFRGKIDRIDRSPGGDFRVVDYKTGSISVKDQDLAGGTSLQLPVYLLAASRILDIPVERGSAMLKRVGAGGGRRQAVFSGATWPRDSEEFGRVLDMIVEGISSGLFFASPRGRDCGYCGARQACPTGLERLFKKKSERDPRAAAYLGIRGTET